MTSTMKEELSKCIFTLTGIFWFCSISKIVHKSFTGV